MRWCVAALSEACLRLVSQSLGPKACLAVSWSLGLLSQACLAVSWSKEEERACAASLAALLLSSLMLDHLPLISHFSSCCWHRASLVSKHLSSHFAFEIYSGQIVLRDEAHNVRKF